MFSCFHVFMFSCFHVAESNRKESAAFDVFDDHGGVCDIRERNNQIQYKKLCAAVSW